MTSCESEIINVAENKYIFIEYIKCQQLVHV